MSTSVDDGAEPHGSVHPPIGAPDRRTRRLVSVAAGAAVLLVLAAVLLGSHRSRPAPPMTEEARAAGAVRLTYPVRTVPPPIAFFPVEGRAPVKVGFFGVVSGADGPLAEFAVGTDADEEWHGIELTAGGQADVGGVRFRAVAVHNGKKAKEDAVDLVVEALP